MKISMGLIGLMLLSLMGCSEGEINYQYMVAKRVQLQPTYVSINLVRRFEKRNWCLSNAKSYNKEGMFKAECLSGGDEYEPMLRGEAVGKWYAIQRFGRLVHTIIFYEFNPPIPDDVMLRELKQLVPHTIKFAALHRAPAEVSIISPKGEVMT